MEKHSLFFIDNEVESLCSTGRLLRGWGFNVDVFSSGDEAIECVRASSKQYSVAIIDYEMPGKNGIETANELKQIDPEMTILIYSAYPSVDVLKESMKMGSFYFVDKGADQSFLKKALFEACDKFEKTAVVR